MSIIRILPEIISNKIAAGEVVERPASVVKELVENALDADSRQIRIEVENGGRSLIRVSDDGNGMGHDDALLSLERYATSKIYSDQDLFSIRTLGFRGEALPSIAAVSRFTLVTREKDASSGTEIRMEGGKILKVSEVGAPPGTLVTVAHLFYNTPARRKFLKSVTTEMGHIAEAVSSMALACPEVRFQLVHNNRTVKNWPPAVERLDRAAEVLGRDLVPDLYPVEKTAEGAGVTGWITSPRVTRAATRSIFIFVNNRYVRDRVIQHALLDGYRQRLVKGQFPMAVLWIAVPHDQVDVNVHPTKSEVRFARHRLIHDLVRSAVAESLSAHDRPRWSSTRSNISEPQASYRPATAAPDVHKAERPEPENRSQSGFDFYKKHGERAFSRKTGLEPAAFTEPAARIDPPEVGDTAKVRPAAAPKRFGELRVVGQFHNTYIVCEDRSGLILIDQHAAHERVLYEQLKHRAESSPKASQRLLVPETVELGYREAGLLEKLLEDFRQTGLEIEPFGGNTFVVKAVPEMLAGREVKPLILEIVDRMADTGLSQGMAAAIDESYKLMACHGAIRAHQMLTDQQIRSLLEQMDGCGNPSHCPHGRPTWVHWTVRELEKAFNRIV
jgi:DNA mismatch repair protein MutL